MFFLFTIAAALAAPPLQCECEVTFDSVVSDVQRNYAGYLDKVTASNRTGHQKLIDEARAKAKAAKGSEECHRAISEYIAFFKDGHLSVSSNAAPPKPMTPDEIRGKFSGWRRISLTEKEARMRISSPGPHDPIEGIWQSVSTPSYRVAILRDRATAGDTLIAAVLKADSVYWTPGQLKFLLARTDSGYSGQFYMQDHSPVAVSPVVQGNVLRFPMGSTWVKEWPHSTGGLSVAEAAESFNSDFRIRSLDPNTLLIQIPSFDNEFAARIDSMFALNETRLRSARDLIVDLRNNRGGSDYNYRHLLPLIYTNPITTVSTAMYATTDNIRRLQALLDNPTFPAGQRTSLERRLESMRRHQGGFASEEDHTTRLDRVLPYPQRVAIIIDRGCASTCEQFILAARQSKKVTLYGTNTSGVLDYANVLRVALAACPELTLHYATSRTKRLPHDPVDPLGIPPNVRIPDSELFPINWVRNRMASRSD